MQRHIARRPCIRAPKRRQEIDVGGPRTDSLEPHEGCRSLIVPHGLEALKIEAPFHDRLREGLQRFRLGLAQSQRLEL